MAQTCQPWLMGADLPDGRHRSLLFGVDGSGRVTRLRRRQPQSSDGRPAALYAGGCWALGRVTRTVAAAPTVTCASRLPVDVSDTLAAVSSAFHHLHACKHACSRANAERCIRWDLGALSLVRTRSTMVSQDRGRTVDSLPAATLVTPAAVPLEQWVTQPGALWSAGPQEEGRADAGGSQEGEGRAGGCHWGAVPAHACSLLSSVP
jgi:hypothetical protein